MISQPRNGPYIADRSNSTPYVNYYSTGQGSKILELVGIVLSFYIWGWGYWSRWSLGSDPFDISPHKLLEKVIIWCRGGSGFRTWRRLRTWRCKAKSRTPKDRSSTSGKRHSRERRAESGAESEDEEKKGGSSLLSKRAGWTIRWELLKL